MNANQVPSHGKTIEDAANEVYRELGVRRRIYGRWVKEGKLSLAEAKARGERMEAALHFLLSHPDMEVGFEPSEDAKEQLASPF